MTVNKLIFLLFAFSSYFTVGQYSERDGYLFVRVYNLEGKKIGNDLLEAVSDSSVSLLVKDSVVTIPLSEIGEIRTKHSVAGNLIIGAIVGTSLGLSLIVGDPDTGNPSVFTGPERIAIVSSGLIIGTLGGLASGLFRKSERYDIDGNHQSLMVFKKAAELHFSTQK